MTKGLPKGYRVICVKEPVTHKQLEGRSVNVPISIHTEFYLGEMYDARFPLDLFTKISNQAADVYSAGFIAIQSSIR